MWQEKKIKRERKLHIEKLYNDYRNLVYNYVAQHIISTQKEDIEDCIEEIFINIIKRYEIDDLKNHNNIRNYIINASKYVVLDFNKEFYAKILKMQVSVPKEKLYDIEDTTTAEHLKLEETQEYMKDLLKDLSFQQRELYSLLYIQNLSLTEVANYYNIDYYAASMRKVRLNNIVKKRLEKKHNEEM